MHGMCCAHTAMGTLQSHQTGPMSAGARLLFVNMRALQGRGYVHASSHVVCVERENVYYLQVKCSLHLFTLTVSVRLLPSRVNAAKTVPT